MRRVLLPLGILILACAVCFAVPAGSGAVSASTASAK
jgi:hypothetical protein